MTTFVLVYTLCVLSVAHALIAFSSPNGDPALRVASGEVDVFDESGGPSFLNAKAAYEAMQVAIHVGRSTANCTDDGKPEYFLICGSALGVWRDGGVCTGDDDIDVAVPHFLLSCVKDVLEKMDISYHVDDADKHWGVFAPESHVSFWGYQLSQDGIYVCFGSDFGKYRDAYPVGMLLPARSATALPLGAAQKKASRADRLAGEVLIPQDPDAYLSLRYGPDWVKPLEAHDPGAKPPLETMNERFTEYCAIGGYDWKL